MKPPDPNPPDANPPDANPPDPNPMPANPARPTNPPARPANPFAPTVDLIESDRGVFGDHAACLRRSLLYRVVQIHQPIEAVFLYDGWWFRQKILVDGRIVWFRISWLTIHRRAEFELPPEIDSRQRRCRMEIDFSRALFIRRFRLWIGDTLVYDEIN